MWFRDKENMEKCNLVSEKYTGVLMMIQLAEDLFSALRKPHYPVLRICTYQA